MARVVEDSAIETHTNNVYPWGDWLNGKTWELTKGEDFKCTMNSMRVQAYKHASKRGGRVKTKINGLTFYIRFLSDEVAQVADSEAGKS